MQDQQKIDRKNELELNITASIVDHLKRSRRILRMDFNIIVYLKGRREYLKAQSKIWSSDSSKGKCAQAKLSEVCELLTILETQSAPKDTGGR